MARVLFVPYPEPGHLNPAIVLGRMAADAGHEVMYSAIPDVCPSIERSGLRATPFFPDLFPEGTVARFKTMRIRRDSREEVVALQRFLRAVVDGAFTQTVQATRPELVVVDAMMFFLVLTAYGQHIPAAVLHTGLPHAEDGTPPVTSGLVPGRGLRHRLLAWPHRGRMRVRSFIVKPFLRRMNLDVDLVGPVLELAAAAGYPRSRINLHEYPSHMLTDVPELILCPPNLDFDRPPRAGRYYLGPMIRRDAAAEPFPWERLDPGKPLIYCALGSQSYLYADGPPLLRTIAKAFRLRPDWQLVMATGDVALDGLDRQPNVVTVRHAPQIALLARAAAFITHAGLNGIKESIVHGVPMLMFPLVNDQPGNAARAAYRGLGIVARPRLISPRGIVERLERLLCDPAYREAVARMQSVFHAMEDSRRNVRILEHLIRRAI